MCWTLIVINVQHMWQSKISIFSVFSNWLLLFLNAYGPATKLYKIFDFYSHLLNRQKMHTFDHMVCLNCAEIFYWTRKASGKEKKRKTPSCMFFALVFNRLNRFAFFFPNCMLLLCQFRCIWLSWKVCYEIGLSKRGYEPSKAKRCEFLSKE